jgi:hypothetical protein
VWMAEVAEESTHVWTRRTVRTRNRASGRRTPNRGRG